MDRAEYSQGGRLENRSSRWRHSWRAIALHGLDELTNQQAKICIDHVVEDFCLSRATQEIKGLEHVRPTGYAHFDEDRVELVHRRKVQCIHSYSIVLA